jgi:hypothetical protein
VTLLVDTGVWSLAFRRDQDSLTPQVAALQAALDGGGKFGADLFGSRPAVLFKPGNHELSNEREMKNRSRI